MKKLMIAFVCSIGVGFAMMASPAQTGDDNIAVGEKTAVCVQTNVSERTNASARQLIKHELKKKKVDFSKISAPKVFPHILPSNLKKGDHPIPPPIKIEPCGGRDNPVVEWLSGGNGDETKTFTVPTRDR